MKELLNKPITVIIREGSKGNYTLQVVDADDNGPKSAPNLPPEPTYTSASKPADNDHPLDDLLTDPFN